MRDAREKLIVAMDVPTLEKVRQTADTLGDAVSFYKVGMESFYSLGPSVLDEMAARRKKVFLDLKLHDIPNTVANGIKSLCRFAPALTTVHAAGGPSMLKAAVAGAQEGAAHWNVTRPRLLGITVLTSISEAEWATVGHTLAVRDSVIRLALLCREAGVDGVVASPQEAAAIREACGNDFLIVTPGVRPAGGDKGDQSRVATPGQALQDGADFLVIGRPILAAAEPRAAALAILKEMEGGRT